MLRAAIVAQVSKPADGPKARPEADWVSNEAPARQSALRQAEASPPGRGPAGVLAADGIHDAMPIGKSRDDYKQTRSL
jgi:hypothetical protein